MPFWFAPKTIQAIMIDEAQVFAIARRAAEGWAFVEPVKRELRKSWRGVPMRWEIRTNSGRRGAIARFVIDARNCGIIEKVCVPR